MDALGFVKYTLLILVSCNVFGLFLSFLPFYVDSIYIRRIQNRKIKIDTFKKRLPLIFLNIVLVMALTAVGIYFLFPLFDASLQFDIWIVIYQVAIVLLLDDFFFFVLHRWLHQNKYLLRKVHSIHHRSAAPFALDYLYVHPYEWMLGYIGPFIGIIAIGMLSSFSIWAFWIYMVIRNLHEIDIHSGFPSLISRWIPFWSESEHHDLHHEKLDGNYASTFTLWDHVFKTKI